MLFLMLRWPLYCTAGQSQGSRPPTQPQPTAVMSRRWTPKWWSDTPEAWSKFFHSTHKQCPPVSSLYLQKGNTEPYVLICYCRCISPVEQCCHLWQCFQSGQAAVPVRWWWWLRWQHFPHFDSTWDGQAPNQLVPCCCTVPPENQLEEWMIAHLATV